MSAAGVKPRTYAALGASNLARVALYRLGLRTGVHPVLRLAAAVPSRPFFGDPAPGFAGIEPRTDWQADGLWFGAHRFPSASPPDWHRNPFSGARADGERDWFKIGDFDPGLGDIKTVWEASRFDWLLAMAQRAASGDRGELDRLNLWLADWARHNPPYRGVNWKCGQEASIRVMHLALAALLLGQAERPEAGLRAFVKLHLARIAPTMSYAIGQQNNHGTSEAAALFIGGSWLAATGDAAGRGWAATGRKWLEERARALIEPDGTFSQYSVVYHRVMLDTYSLAETWRRRFGLPDFSAGLRERLELAVRWMQQMVDPGTGDTPNLGANDGARLMALTDGDYRDFRPSLQWASVLFAGARAFTPGPWDHQLEWLAIPLPDALLSAPESRTLGEGGLHILRVGRAAAYLRYPRFRFRPGQSDLLHLDLWVGGENLLRDGGTYSYNSSNDDLDYFGGVASHSTAQFDGRDQMPRLGRFLFGGWPAARDVAPVSCEDHICRAAAGYRDHWGAEHRRTLELHGDRLICSDELDGNAKEAVLRWRLRPGDWQLDGNRIGDGRCLLTVESEAGTAELRIVEGAESRYYLDKTSLPVLEIRVPVPSAIRTIIEY